MIALVLAGLAAAAPDDQSALWLGVEGELELSKAVEVSLSEEVRQEVLPTGDSELVTRLEARAELLDWLGLEGAYRLSADLGTGELSHRTDLDLRLEHRVGKVELAARERWQVDLGPDPVHTLRTRVGAELRTDSLRPWVAVEPWVWLTGGVELRRVRLTLGTKLPTELPALKVFTHLDLDLDGDKRLVLGLRGKFGAELHH